MYCMISCNINTGTNIRPAVTLIRAAQNVTVVTA